MTVALWGLKNCDTCRKAWKWLEAEGIAYDFHDIRGGELEADRLSRWIAAAGWETLLNRRGTTWRGLSDAEKDGVDEAKAAALMLEHPALVKRPVIEAGDHITVGFGAAQQDAIKSA